MAENYRRFPFPLRLSIPAILLLFGGLLSVFSFQREVSLSYLRTEEDMSRQTRSIGDQTSGMLEYLFVFRQTDIEAAGLIISKLGSNPNLQVALVCDQNNKIILATRYELRNRLLINTPAVNRLSDVERVRQNMSGQVIFSKDKRSIRAIYPVMLGAVPDELRPSKVGILFLEYDISASKQRSYNDALQRSLESNVVLALLCTTVWLFFDKTLTRRVVRLVEATNCLAKGEFGVRAGLQGSDELTQIATAFDQMANRIQVNQQELQELTQQRRELLNLLVSQIRNSFNLDTILSTAVRETCNLLGVDRCNFMWYESDPLAPSFALTHESQLPGLPSVLGQYPIEDPKSSYLKDLLSFKTVRIDNLTTDTFLDAPLRSRLIAQGYVSFISCPIQTRSSKLGIVTCAYCHTLYSWSDDQVELLQSVANQLAIAIDQAELYEQTRVAATTATAQAEQLRQTLEELQQIQALLQVTLDSTADGILAINQAGNIAGFNKKFVEMWGIPESLLGLQDNQCLAFMFEQIIDHQASPFKVGELGVQDDKNHDILVTKDGRIFERYSQPRRLNGKIVGEVWSFRDITERSLAESKIRYQALHDLLTGLPNRILFQDRLSLALTNAKQRQGMLAVMFMDLDRFKTINDTLGHAVGDRLLQGIAKRLTSCLREGDSVARWGGDEFTLLLPQITNVKEADIIAQRILAALKPAFQLEGHQLYITNSIGIALYPNDGEDAETLLKNADAALYRTKEQGRNNYQLYTSTMNSDASESLTIENSLHHALERGEFVVYYQPKVNINTWEITGMEALLRWQHPELGLVSPVTFIPLAEANGLIVPIGEWVLQTACTQNKAWQNLGLSPIRIAVNLSARQFQQPNLVASVARVLEKTGLDPHFLELEITETTVMQEVKFARAILKDLQQTGIRLAMDDFGTGYSSLSYLKKFPLDTIKIDRSFIYDLAVDPYDQAIATAVIALGHGLNLNVVAEGVETKAQLDCLRSLHCEEMQGYFFSRPLSVDNATKLLQNTLAKTVKVF